MQILKLRQNLVLLLAAAGFCISSQAGAASFSWSGIIDGEDPTFTTTGEADFSISGGVLTITLTNTSTDTSEAIGELLTVLTWDITDAGVSLTPISALIASGSSLQGVGATSDTDLSSEWGFKSNLSAGSTLEGPLGAFGISAVGDVNDGADSFGTGDRFDQTTNLFGPANLNGVEGGIVGTLFDPTKDGFKSQGPVVQNQMVFTFDVTGNLTDDEITNVQPLFGSDGAPVIPEPSSALLYGMALLAVSKAGPRRAPRT